MLKERRVQTAYYTSISEELDIFMAPSAYQLDISAKCKYLRGNL